MKYNIKDAVKNMLLQNEFPKIIKHAKGRDKENAKEFYNAVNDLTDEQFEKIPPIVFINACRSWNVWADIYCFLEFMNRENEE